MTMTMGTSGGFVEPGPAGQTDPFPYENLNSEPIRRLAENRLAGLRNATLDAKMTFNDVVASHRAVYSGRNSTRHPRLLAAFHPGAGTNYGNASNPSAARAASGTILEGTGKAVGSPGDLTRHQGVAVGSLDGFYTINLGTGRSNEIFVQGLSVADVDVNTIAFSARMTNTSNMIDFNRQGATNIRTNRTVAGVGAVERNTTIPSTTPTNGNAFGIRLSGTSAALFLNGAKIDEWTLHADAQGLTGTLIGFYTPSTTYALVGYWEAWSLTPVNGL